MGEKIEFARGQGVDQGVRQRGDLGLERGDPARGEGAQDERAQPRVARRFQFQHRMRLDRVEGLQVIGNRPAEFFRLLAAEPAVPQDGAHRGGRGGADQVVILPVEEGAGRTGAPVERVRVLDETRLRRILAEAGQGHGCR